MFVVLIRARESLRDGRGLLLSCLSQEKVMLMCLPSWMHLPPDGYSLVTSRWVVLMTRLTQSLAIRTNVHALYSSSHHTRGASWYWLLCLQVGIHILYIVGFHNVWIFSWYVVKVKWLQNHQVSFYLPHTQDQPKIVLVEISPNNYWRFKYSFVFWAKLIFLS